MERYADAEVFWVDDKSTDVEFLGEVSFPLELTVGSQLELCLANSTTVHVTITKITKEVAVNP